MMTTIVLLNIIVLILWHNNIIVTSVIMTSHDIVSRTSSKRRELINPLSPVSRPRPFFRARRTIRPSPSFNVNSKKRGRKRSYGRSIGLPSDRMKMIVDLHNELRRKQKSSDMYHLTWNYYLARSASSWAGNCVWEHGSIQEKDDDEQLSKEAESQKKEPPQVEYSDFIGQNLFLSTSGRSFKPDIAVSAWYREVQNYTYDSNSCRSGAECGHYKQVVWSTTRHIGCGYHRCPLLADNDGNHWRNAQFLVCNYGPPGNYKHAKPFKLGQPCSECHGESMWCYKGLCGREQCKTAIKLNANRTTIFPSRGFDCQCNIRCQNGGKVNESSCTCICSKHYTGHFCQRGCGNFHQYCNATPGWPNWWCSLGGHKGRLANQHCPLMCQTCVKDDQKMPYSPCNRRCALRNAAMMWIRPKLLKSEKIVASSAANFRCTSRSSSQPLLSGAPSSASSSNTGTTPSHNLVNNYLSIFCERQPSQCCPTGYTHATTTKSQLDKKYRNRWYKVNSILRFQFFIDSLSDDLTLTIYGNYRVPPSDCHVSTKAAAAATSSRDKLEKRTASAPAPSPIFIPKSALLKSILLLIKDLRFRSNNHSSPKQSLESELCDTTSLILAFAAIPATSQIALNSHLVEIPVPLNASLDSLTSAYTFSASPYSAASRHKSQSGSSSRNTRIAPIWAWLIIILLILQILLIAHFYRQRRQLMKCSSGHGRLNKATQITIHCQQQLRRISNF